MGRWKDGLCDCCSTIGCCHVSNCMALCFPRLLLAQILTRLKLDLCANPASDRRGNGPNTFRQMFILMVVFSLYQFFFSCATNPYLDEIGNEFDVRIRDNDCPRWLLSLNWAITGAVAVYTFILLVKTRRAVRERYQIPARDCCCCCGGACCDGLIEDAVVSFFCGCCSLGQMARQTTDYQRHGAACCTRDGCHSATRPSTTTMTV